MGKFSGKKCRLLTMFSLTAGFFVVEITGMVTNLFVPFTSFSHYWHTWDPSYGLLNLVQGHCLWKIVEGANGVL